MVENRKPHTSIYSHAHNASTAYCWFVQAVRMYPGQPESPQNQWLRDIRMEGARCVTSGLHVALSSCMAACQTCSPTDILDFRPGQSFSVPAQAMIHGVFEAIATYVRLRGSLTATHFTVYPYGWVALRGKKMCMGVVNSWAVLI